jgi:hypothetical protein
MTREFTSALFTARPIPWIRIMNAIAEMMIFLEMAFTLSIENTTSTLPSVDPPTSTG